MAAPRFRNELPLILASLFIAAVIWLIAKQADYEPARLDAAVVLNNVPPTLIVEAPVKVGIRVQYPKSLSNMIVDKNFSVPIDIEQLFGPNPEEKWDRSKPIQLIQYRLTPGSVKTTLDPTVQVFSVDPGEIELRVRLRTQTADVTVITQGTLPGNLMLVGIKPDPPKVTFAGSPEALKKLADAGNTVKTEPLDLGTLRAPGGLYSRHVIPPAPGLFLLGQRTVTINAAVAERPVRQTLPNVPITLVTFAPNLKAVVDPDKASVVLEGPASALQAVGAADIEFSTVRELEERPGRVYDIGLEARLKATVPPEAARAIKIVETRPSRISVEFVPLDKDNK